MRDEVRARAVGGWVGSEEPARFHFIVSEDKVAATCHVKYLL